MKRRISSSATDSDNTEFDGELTYVDDESDEDFQLSDDDVPDFARQSTSSAHARYGEINTRRRSNARTPVSILLPIDEDSS